ncbi:MAG: spore cortex-lytic protein [Oscillospiraceae bacterium]|nr:spore cortex-lytic protein [Oscillospiraceae bacterium]
MSAQGFLQTHVFTSDANLPLGGASVAVWRVLPDGTQELLAFRKTDSSGNTAIIAIPSPEPSASLNPSRPGGFSSVTITADMPRYERVRIENVQIFPGIVTQQDIRLTPLDALPQVFGGTERFEITPQGL